MTHPIIRKEFTSRRPLDRDFGIHLIDHQLTNAGNSGSIPKHWHRCIVLRYQCQTLF